ncbi:MAG: PAS domain-containing protein [Myxococcota bacterium]|nr:PAS domain-containing protein [Myxococcota bacterium]
MEPVARPTPPVPALPTFSAFIRERKQAILAAWEATVRQMPIAAKMARPALLDHVPDLLDRIAEMADELAAGELPRLPPDLAEVHAVERLDDGFDLSQVIAEYGALRDCIMQMWRNDSAGESSTRALHQAIDRAIGASVQRFTLARDRTLVALDRISSAALETRTLEELLDRLLRVFLETTAAVDTATVLLLDGDVLRVRASVGLEAALAHGWSVKIGEGFAGRIALTGKPLALENASTNELVLSPHLRAKKLLALFGVPLVEAGAVIGVAHMGSLTAQTFSTQDQRLLIAMANRASSAISLHMLREREQALQKALESSLAQQHVEHAAAERTLAVMDTILAGSALGIGFIDNDLRYVRINDALATLNGIAPSEHVGRGVREILGDQTAELLEPILRRVLETRQPTEHLVLQGAPRDAPDQVRWFDASYVPVVTSHGELLGIGAVVIDVTEHKRLETELRDREIHFRLLADNISQLAWIGDETGSLIWYNERWYNYTGTTFEQMQGWGWRAVHHPAHLDRVVEKFSRHLASGEVWEDTFPLRGADGRYRWFLSRAMPIRDEHGRVLRWFGTNTDVTEQRVMHEAMVVLSSSRDYHETLEQVAQLAVPTLGDWCAIDILEGNEVKRLAVAHIDPAKVALAHELLTRYPLDPNARVGIPNVIRTGVTEYTESLDERRLPQFVRDLGLKAYVVAPLIARDRTYGAISIVSAESGRRYTSVDIGTIEELGRRCALAIDNARLFAEAQRETRLREDMLAVVSHDLKSPLSAVQLAASALAANAEPPARKSLETIQRSARRMDHLLGDLLDMSSIQAGRLGIERKPEELEVILREAVESHEPHAREKGLRIVRQCELPGAKLSVDRDRILQVLGNLLGNAIKFCQPGNTITVDCRRVDEVAQLSVIDDGPGITHAELPRVFEPYWSAKEHAKKGTGLGLFISKGIVEAHGGRLWVDSRPGEGAAFHFTIPFA